MGPTAPWLMFSLTGVTNLLLFDGTYRLQRQEDAPLKLGRKWACAWRLRVFDFSKKYPGVQHLRPYAVVATQTGEGIFKTTCAESLGSKICRDFDLNVDEILWVEHYPDEQALYVAIFSPKSYYGTEIFYDVDWRPIMPNELNAIRPLMPEIKDFQCP
jgi:hypothetical protein